jgi:hypothetical protein
MQISPITPRPALPRKDQREPARRQNADKTATVQRQTTPAGIVGAVISDTVDADDENSVVDPDDRIDSLFHQY